ncbi:MAG: EamA family transporter RarD [Rhizobiaceae bacterium]|nr:EamA family transporter RarD [Rhizobiaceae bacterium]
MGGKETDKSALRGFGFAMGAYLLWGVMPLYMKMVSHIPPVEVVAYRILCSVPVAGILILLLGRTADLKLAFRHPKTLLLAAITAIFISINWGIYVWAIANEQTVETALGYYINPIVNIALGAVFLGERFNRLQMAAIALVCAAILLLTVTAGGLPWVSLALAFSFGMYGFLRKTLPIGPSQGFFLEVLLLSVPSLLVLYFLDMEGTGHFMAGDTRDTGLLLLAGPFTAVPLILYAFGAKLLRFSTLGLMQYLTPSLIFLAAIFVFHEPLSMWQLAAFCLIWIALALYTWSSLRESRVEARPLL